ncbi:flippase [Patescibacteria group bacterium]|nr:flippase [Patescibacteria group bacterium]
MSLPRQIFSNTIIQVIGKITSTGLNLVAFALMTRDLGQSGFGEYTTVITFLSFFAIIADLGLTLVTVQMINSDKDNEDKILGNLFGLRLASALLFIGLAPAIILLFNYSNGIKIGVLIAAASFIFTALNQIMVGLFQSRLKMNRVVWAEVLSRFILIIGVILALKYHWGLNGMLAAVSIASLGNFLLHFYFARNFAKIKPKFSLFWWRKITNLSWPLAVTIAFNLIYLRADTLILSLIKSQAEVGLYGAAYKIIDVFSSLPFMFAGVILPLLVSTWQKQDLLKFKKIIQKSFDILSIIALPIVVGTQFLADEIIILIAGPDFVEAGMILRVLILAVAAIFLGNIMSHAVVAIEAQKKVIWIYVFTSITALIAYLILIPRFSYFGAAAVTIYSESAIAILSTIFIYKKLNIKVNLIALNKAVAASLLMGFILWLFPVTFLHTLLGLTSAILIAIISYAFFLWLFNVFNKADFQLILNKQ